MMKPQALMSKFNLLCIVWGFLFLAAFHFYFFKTKPLVENRSLIRPPKIQNFTFGFSEHIADQLWIRSIQDLDFCEKKESETRCRKDSWLYSMLDLIVDLSPHFRKVQAVGPIALTVLISDIEGASKLFDRAVANFPNDWPILYRASYQAMEEEKDYDKAAKLLIRAAQNGGPPWFYSLAGRLYTKEGRIDLAEVVYQDVKKDPTLGEFAERIRKTIDSSRQ